MSIRKALDELLKKKPTNSKLKSDLNNIKMNLAAALDKVVEIRKSEGDDGYEVATAFWIGIGQMETKIRDVAVTLHRKKFDNYF
jgi:hypothetical protein